MTLTNEELQQRIEQTEKWINFLQANLNNTATRREMKNLIALVSSQITSLSDQVGNIEATGALYPPRLTTTERDVLIVTDGATIFNTTTDTLQVYNGSSWSEASFEESSIDHGSISGLSDDDHSQYLLVDGTRTATGEFTFDNDINVNGVALLGSTADADDAIGAGLIVSQGDSGYTHPQAATGLLSEAVADSDNNLQGYGMVGIGKAGTSGWRGIGVVGRALASDPDDGTAIGGNFTVSSSRTVGTNIGLLLNASNAPTNYSLRILRGDIDSALFGDSINWNISDNNSTALSFGSSSYSNLLVLDTTNSSEKVKMSGGIQIDGSFVSMSSLPISDPGVTGQIYADSSDGYTLKQSQG